MLIEADLPNLFWGEAANFMQNRFYSRIISKTPYEVWNNVKPDLSYFHPFGSKAYIFISDQCRSKLDGKSAMKTLIAYDDHIKGYRLLDVKTRKIIISRNVRFVDNNFKDTENNEEYIEEKNYDIVGVFLRNRDLKYGCTFK